jgi:predicted metalloprotease with PDZ domain
MFHGWLGEAIMQEDTQMLWFVEGATTWYATRFLREAGIWNSWRAESVVGERVTQNYYDNPLLGQISVAEAAAGIMSNAMTTRFAYAGGALAIANLDRWLATISGALRPLDAVLQHLYAHREGSPLTRSDLVAAVRAVTGADCNDWLDLYVYGKETLPRLETLF